MNCIHKFSHTIKGFVFALGFCFTFHGMLNNGIVLVNVSTIERRFHFTSTKSGIIASCYDITSCILCPLVTYFGSNSHKPRVVAAGLMIYVVGCILNFMPHFITESYYPPGNAGAGLCSESSNISETSNASGESSAPFVLFIMGSISLGAGTVPLLTLGLAYIDDNTTKGKSASYIGIIGGLASIGSICGFLIGGYSLSYYVNGGDNTHGLSSKDPAWVGNWWAPYLLATAMAVCAVLMLLQFPKEIEKSRVSDDDSKECVRPNDAKSIKWLLGLPFAIKTLMKNTVMMLTIVANAVDSFLLSGFSVFFPKFLQNQFLLSPTMASVLEGTVSVPGAFVGHVVSGFVVRKYQMTVPTILKTIGVATFISGILCLSTMLHCSNPVRNVVGGCQLDEQCRCDSSTFRPVCGNDSIVYFSPCHAGCRRQSPDVGHFHDCLCVNQNNSSSAGTAKSGRCDERCETVIPFLILLFFIILLSFFTMTPAMMVVMRCVSPTQKSLAVGLYWLVNRLLGSIPGPLVFGRVFDASCTVWMKQGHGGQFCWVYDNAKLARTAVILTISMKMVSFCGYLLALQRSRNSSHDVPKTEQERELQPADESRL